jgi:hypothetical protein
MSNQDRFATRVVRNAAPLLECSEPVGEMVHGVLPMFNHPMKRSHFSAVSQLFCPMSWLKASSRTAASACSLKPAQVLSK